MNNEPYYKILIVDDDVSDLELLNNILQPYYTIYTAKSGVMAINRAKENKPDLILLDVVMPDMSGFDVLSELKKLDVIKDIPVIIITGLSSVEDEENGFQLGAVDYISKPFHRSIVKARVKAHLKLAHLLQKSDNASIIVKTRKEVRNVLFRELVYVEKMGHWLNFNLIDGSKVTVYATLKEYDNILLADARFAHCHKSFIVNMDYIVSVEVRSIFLKNNIELPISKSYIDIKKKYTEWYSG